MNSSDGMMMITCESLDDALCELYTKIAACMLTHEGIGSRIAQADGPLLVAKLDL